MLNHPTLRLTSLAIGCVLALWAGAVAAQSPPPEPDAATPSPDPAASIAPGSPAPAAARPEGTWLVAAYDAWGDGLMGPLRGSTLTVSLLPAGRLEGETGCGTYVGGYSVDGARIRLGVISKGPDPCGTRRTDEAFAFTQALAVATTWAASPSGLELLDDDGQVRVSMIRPGGEGLAGDWVVQRYALADGALRSALEGSAVSIVLGEDGQVAGSTGCRLFEGRYEAEIDRVIIAIDVVGLPCEGEERRQDRQVRAALDAAVQWQRDGDVIILSDADGAPLAELSLAPTESPSEAPSEAPEAAASAPPAESAPSAAPDEIAA